jgi:hypothetical protein
LQSSDCSEDEHKSNATKPSQSGKKFRGSINALANTVISQKSRLRGSIVKIYNQRFGKPAMVAGSRNQFENVQGLRETCSGATLAFLDRSLRIGQKKMNSSEIDRALDSGLGIYCRGITAKKKQAKVLGVSETDAHSTQLHPYNLLGYVDNGLNTKVSPKSTQVGSKKELQARIALAIDTTLIPTAQDSHPQRAGMTITFNGKTFALNVEINHGQVSYSFFDSHGTKDSGGKAYTFQTNHQIALCEFIGGITTFISREPDDALKNMLSPSEISEISKPLDGDNELGFLVVAPKTAA